MTLYDYHAVTKSSIVLRCGKRSGVLIFWSNKDVFEKIGHLGMLTGSAKNDFDSGKTFEDIVKEYEKYNKIF